VASGQATYYGVASGSCASKVAPRGATVKVTNQATGASITCVVNDYEEATWPRVIDLSSADFGRLASLSSGVISVTLEW
jgi:rare lipoprotein A (peptidoglycan hydrolase)